MNAINNKDKKSNLEKDLRELEEGLSKVKKRKISKKQDRGTSTRECEEDISTPQTFEGLDDETIKTMENMIEENKTLTKERTND